MGAARKCECALANSTHCHCSRSGRRCLAQHRSQAPCSSRRSTIAEKFRREKQTSLAKIPMLAHVKWFAPFNVAEGTKPIGDVLDRRFVILFLASVVSVFGFFVIDRIALRRKLLAALDER